MTSPPDEKAIRERLARIAELFGGIVAHADASARTRCPYRDRNDRCTGKFRCRNQLERELAMSADTVPQPGQERVFLCTHDGRFDYRDAWESHPRSYDKAKERIRTIRREARQRRQAGPEGDLDP